MRRVARAWVIQRGAEVHRQERKTRFDERSEQGPCRSTSTTTRLFEDESYWIIGHETPFRVSVAFRVDLTLSFFAIFFIFLGGGRRRVLNTLR